MFPKVKKQIKDIAIYRHSIPQSCFFIHNICSVWEKVSKVIHTQKYIYLDKRCV